MGTTVFERQRPSEAAVSAALRGTRQSVFWLDDLLATTTDQRPSLHGTEIADLAIVGAGYTGLWTALLAHRRDPGRRIVVLEAEKVGWAASGRNGGFVEASLTHGEENGRSRWPAEMEVLTRLGASNLDGIERDLAEWGAAADFERSGSITVAVEPHQLDWLRESGNKHNTFLDSQGVRGLLDSPTYLGGLLSPTSTALVHPGKLVAELSRVAEAQGIRIFEHSPIRRIDRADNGRPQLVGEDGRVVATDVALATNAFPALLKRNRLMTVPVYDYVLMTEPLTEPQLASIGWQGRQGVSDMANQFHYYRLTSDNRILWGGYDAVYHPGGRIRPRYEDRQETFHRLASHFLTTFPQIEEIRFSHRWAGVIDTSTRFCAFFGTARAGRIAYAAGFTGLGVAATRFAGEVMLDLLEGQPTERTELQMVRERPLPFPPEPIAAAGITATRWAMDRADHREGRRNLLLRTLDAFGLGFDS